MSGLICEWILAAWNFIPSNLVMKNFKMCNISNSLDGNEDNAIRDEEHKHAPSQEVLLKRGNVYFFRLVRIVLMTVCSCYGRLVLIVSDLQNLFKYLLHAFHCAENSKFYTNTQVLSGNIPCYIYNNCSI